MRRRYRGVLLLMATCMVGVSALALHAFGPTGKSEIYAKAFKEEQERVANLKAKYSKDYQLNDQFELIGVDSRLSEGGEEASETYLGTLGWVGTLRLKFTHARWFSSPEDAGLAEYVEYETIGEARYLLIDMEVANIDAVSDWEELAEDNMIFMNIDLASQSFRDAADDEGNYARDLVDSMLIYNSGEAEQDIINNRSVIAIPQGQTQTVTLGWAIESRAEDGTYPVDEPLVLYFGDAGSDGHCTVHLGVPEVG